MGGNRNDRITLMGCELTGGAARGILELFRMLNRNSYYEW